MTYLNPINNFTGNGPLIRGRNRVVLEEIAEAVYRWIANEDAIIEQVFQQRPIQPSGGRSSIAIGEITNIIGNGIGGDVTYDAKSYAGPSLEVESATPINRPFGDADITPCAEGDPCLLFRDKDDTIHLIQLTEAVVWDECDNEGVEESISFTRTPMRENGYSESEELAYLIARGV